MYMIIIRDGEKGGGGGRGERGGRGEAGEGVWRWRKREII